MIGTVDSLAAEPPARRRAPAPRRSSSCSRNTEFWTHAAFPAASQRITFGRDPAVFQYYPGRGMQLQPLASWGKANWLAGECLRARAKARRRAACPVAELRRTVDRLLELAARARRLPRLGALLQLGRRHAAVDQRHDAGDRDLGARPREPGARRAALAPRRPPRARRVHDAAAGRRRRRRPLPHVLVRARPCASSTASCRRSTGSASWRRRIRPTACAGRAVPPRRADGARA